MGCSFLGGRFGWLFGGGGGWVCISGGLGGWAGGEGFEGEGF